MNSIPLSKEIQKMKLFKSFPPIIVILGILWVSTTSLWGLESGLMIKDAQIIEGDEGVSMMEFTVIVSATPAIPIEVIYKTSDGTAKAGKDYKQTTGKAIIAAGQKNTTFLIPIFNDKKPSKNSKIFHVTISSSKAAVFVAKATGTIVDNEVTITEAKKESSSEDSKKGKQ